MKIKKVLTAILFLTVCFLFASTSFGAVEIDLQGPGKDAKKAMSKMSQARTQIKNQISEPFETLNAQIASYEASGCTKGSDDGGCKQHHNQILKSYRELLTQISTFMTDYEQNAGIVVKDLEPKIAQIAQTSTLKNLNKDFANKYTDLVGVGNYEEEWLKDLMTAVGADIGATPFELYSDMYLEYKSKLSQYKKANMVIKSKVLEAERLEDLGPLLNKETIKKFGSMVKWVTGGVNDNKTQIDQPENQRVTILK